MTLIMGFSIAFWQQLLIQIAATGLTVLLVLSGFHRWVIKPQLDRNVKEIAEIAETIEPRVTRGVKIGVSETLRELPESTMQDSTRQFLRFGSDLMENGLSSFLGGSKELQHRSRSNRNPGKRDKMGGSEAPGDRS
ncbi:MAG: hypothetical protein WD623_16850 [Marinobacter sp.]|uniref:hypothetical protein n=1 Tax=Marinobacter sp. TaxID=50741 RepID=UPI0034A04BBA